MSKKKTKLDYFEAFEHQTEIACKEADLLVETVESFTSADELTDVLERAHQIEHEGDEVNHTILQSVATDFITPFDRDDLIVLAQALDDVIDSIEDIIQSFYMYDVHLMHQNAIEEAHLIKKSTKALNRAMKDFRNFKKSKKFNELMVAVSEYEEQGDRFYMETLRHMYTVERDHPVHVAVWTRIFDRMEAACDACEHAADKMGDVVLKNS